MELNKVYNMDWVDGLKTLHDNSIDMCITSPPYWGLRDYGVDGQLGLEPHFDEYIQKLCDGFDEVRRVLKDTGTCWVNIGDSYGGSGAGTTKDLKKVEKYNPKESFTLKRPTPSNKLRNSNLNKSLIGIPFHFALEMINHGWILRNTIIWHKPNCMPSSVKDRFTVDFEYLFFFSKSKKYYFEQQFEPIKEVSIKRLQRAVSNKHKNINGAPGQPPHTMNKPRPNIKKCSMAAIQNSSGFDDKDHLVAPFDISKGRNMRAVWTITTKPYKDAHFAVFPPELIETPIKAGCPLYVCSKCGKPRIKNIKTEKVKRERLNDTTKPTRDRSPSPNDYAATKIIKGDYGDCGCNADFRPGIVLDPFIGSGTTAMVAKQLGRNYIGFELNPDYMALVENRVNNVTIPLDNFAGGS